MGGSKSATETKKWLICMTCTKHATASIGEPASTGITDAFLKADPFIRTKGSGGRMFKISETINNMEAFTKLTDKLFDEILHSTSTDLAEASRILQNITQRRFYKKKCNGLKSNLENGIQNCVREDFVLDEISMDWGMGKDNPIDHVRFYRKQRIKNAFPIRQHQVSSLLPQRFSVKWICESTVRRPILRLWMRPRGSSTSGARPIISLYFRLKTRMLHNDYFCQCAIQEGPPLPPRSSAPPPIWVPGDYGAESEEEWEDESEE
ncbi:hypothetical protein DPEC_G00005960 [Dallia pectoralis]|uniref:Uncharacterized protein n=1 Tax=Dallia pectoralis TaxID=75939 RepID=A0ACC2HJW3_DALPE|nr:hypothetical protein DPEC_G00005960 [Dallia pectoralis]